MFFGFIGQFVAETSWIRRGSDHDPPGLLIERITVLVLV